MVVSLVAYFFGPPCTSTLSRRAAGLPPSECYENIVVLTKTGNHERQRVRSYDVNQINYIFKSFHPISRFSLEIWWSVDECVCVSDSFLLTTARVRTKMISDKKSRLSEIVQDPSMSAMISVHRPRKLGVRGSVGPTFSNGGQRILFDPQF